jgi:hypothetical protein
VRIVTINVQFTLSVPGRNVDGPDGGLVPRERTGPDGIAGNAQAVPVHFGEEPKGIGIAMKHLSRFGHYLVQKIAGLRVLTGLIRVAPRLRRSNTG